MVRKEHKFLCLVLCLALILTTVFTGAVSVFAATEDESEPVGASGDTVYVKANNGWTNLHCYMWTDNQGNNAQWPGAAMQAVKDDVYSYTVTGNFSKIIFNNGNSGSGNQTSDLSYPGTGKIYDLKTGTWSDYTDAPTPTQTPDPTSAPDPGNGTLVYFKNTANWSAPKCYMWTDNQGNNAQWPGASMTEAGEGVWMYQTSQTFAKCIFNPGSDSGKTADLTVQNGMMFNYATSQWEDPDFSDLRIVSFAADPTSDVYTGTEVSLTASATSKVGTVSYRFSVKNAAGSESEIAGFSTVSSATWTPTQAGNYTLTLDVKDTAGNEKSKTLSVTVQNDAGLTKPVVKTVTPANLNLVKRNAQTTISVSAGGGQTGTNLLFYKYIVSDPNGVENTPYYTLNSTYDYVFTKLGTYTVNVFVQASDNSTVSKTYTYTVTDDMPDPTVRPTTPTPTQAPTTVKPTQAPTQAPTTLKPTTPKPTEPDVTVSPTTNPAGYQKGDANKDHYVDIKDATYIQMHVAEYLEAKNIDVSIADMDGNGKITVVDATLIQFYIAS